MGWTETLPDGDHYRACWRDDTGRKRSTTSDPQTLRRFTREAHALRVAGEMEGRARRGETSADGRAPTWGDWSARWLELRRVEPGTARQDQVRINRYLTPRWGTTRINRIRRADVQRWVNDLCVTDSIRGTPLSAGSVDRIYRLLSTSLKAAVHAQLLAVSPCVGITLPTSAPGVERFLTKAEVDSIINNIHDARDGGLYRCVVNLLTETGLRFGELAGLHWHRVDLEQGLIHVVETWDAADRRIKPYPKSKKGRAVPISDRALEALSALKARQGDQKTCGLDHVTGKCRSPLVATPGHGMALDGHNLGRRQWAAACQRSGVDARLHDCRHTYASWLVQAGVPLQEVGRLLGHSTTVVTERYAHLGSSQHAAVLAALNSSGM